MNGEGQRLAKRDKSVTLPELHELGWSDQKILLKALETLGWNEAKNPALLKQETKAILYRAVQSWLPDMLPSSPVFFTPR